jgi:hypothetical protein
VKSIYFLISILTLITPQVQAGPEGWIKLQTSHADFDLYYQPLSIQTLPNGHVKVTSLMNYQDKNRAPASLFSESLYNCADQMNLDLLVSQHEGYWADGEIIAVSEKSQWRKVLPHSVGATLMAAACNTANSTQFQR